MEAFFEKKSNCSGDALVKPGRTDTWVQLVISVSLGFSALFAFCLLRPRWKTLYAARRRRLDPRVALPKLPDTFLGWMPALYRVTEEQVLASAGLDAFVFLQFFKMAMKLFTVLFFFAAVVLEPINQRFARDFNTDEGSDNLLYRLPTFNMTGSKDDDDPNPDNSFNYDMGYLWAYLVFTYLFSVLALYLTDKETHKIIRIRQDYLGTQYTITDRTFKLSGIPKELRTEANIKTLVEQLEIGDVENVTLCRNWKELDDSMDERASVLSKLEESWAVLLDQKPGAPPAMGRLNASSRHNGSSAVDEETGEGDGLLDDTEQDTTLNQPRPQTRVWYGFMRLRSRKTDAIDHFEERLRRLDEKIGMLRKHDFAVVDQAFVTMDSIAACQMAIQALIDPRPGQLLTKLAPAPSDVVWRNTYASRRTRRLKSGLITIFIGVLSIVWLIPVAAIATLFSLCTIEKLSPEIAHSLKQHEITKALVQTGIPTGVVSLLNVAVPYLYWYLSYQQGKLSNGEVELSVISKNFFFTFFNIFVVFTVFGAATQILPILKESLSDTTYLARELATNIQNLSAFYQNFIMLQGIGLFPFRLLEFGSVSLYPISKMGAKTPREFAEITVPPTFSFGFYLPTALLVFILCLVYSVLKGGYLVLLLGLIYFTLGYFTYKYQLLYAMDQPQHATGGAWRIICYRIVLGLAVFQITMAGYLVLQLAFVLSALIVPLLLGTVYYSYTWKQRFEPLTNFIALRSIRRPGAVDEDGGNLLLDEDFGGPGRIPHEPLRRGSTVDEDREKGLRFVNPNLVTPLQQPWIRGDQPPARRTDDSDDSATRYHDEEPNTAERQDDGEGNASNDSTVSLGDTHIWRENDANQP